MTTNATPAKSRCPECDARIFFERPPDLGQMLECPECGTRLEVIRLSPIELDWAGDDGGEAKGGSFVDEALFGRPARDEFSRGDEYGAVDDDDSADW
jgi:lysine biosynthesis protein LysW